MGLYWKELKEKDIYDVTYKARDIIPDPYGPVKYDLIEPLLRSFQEMTQRLAAVEEHLEKGAGKPFVRAAERPDVGGDAVRQMTESVRLLEQRLGNLSKSASQNNRETLVLVILANRLDPGALLLRAGCLTTPPC